MSIESRPSAESRDVNRTLRSESAIEVTGVPRPSADGLGVTVDAASTSRRHAGALLLAVAMVLAIARLVPHLVAVPGLGGQIWLAIVTDWRRRWPAS